VQITITARHCEVADDVRERASEMAARLMKIAHRPQTMEIVFDDEHARKHVELRLSLPRGQVLVASAGAEDFRTALDRAVEKLRPQLERSSARSERRQHTG